MVLRSIIRIIKALQPASVRSIPASSCRRARFIAGGGIAGDAHARAARAHLLRYCMY